MKRLHKGENSNPFDTWIKRLLTKQNNYCLFARRISCNGDRNC